MTTEDIVTTVPGNSISPFSQELQQSPVIRIPKRVIHSYNTSEPSQEIRINLDSNDQQQPLLESSTDDNTNSGSESNHACCNCQCY